MVTLKGNSSSQDITLGEILVSRYWLASSPIALAFYSLVDAIWERLDIPERCKVVTTREIFDGDEYLSSNWEVTRGIAITRKYFAHYVSWRDHPTRWLIACDGDIIPTRKDALFVLNSYINTLPDDITLCVRLDSRYHPQKGGAFWLSAGRGECFIPSVYYRHFPDGMRGFNLKLFPLLNLFVYHQSRSSYLTRAVGELIDDSVMKYLQEKVLPGVAFFPSWLLGGIATQNPPVVNVAEKLPVFFHPMGYNFTPALFSFLVEVWRNLAN